jgi:hypothetical protein
MADPLDFPYRLGKLEAVRPPGLLTLDKYRTTPVGTPPTSIPIPLGLKLAMGGNGPDPSCTLCPNGAGDCVIAGAGNEIIILNEKLGRSNWVPTSNDDIEQYSDLTGFDPQTGANDTGLEIAAFLQGWRTSGLYEPPIGPADMPTLPAYAPLDLGSMEALKQCIWLYGVVRIGCQVPQSAMEQTQNNEPWTIVPGSPIMGGHNIEGFAFDPEYLYIATWGQVQAVAWSWIGKYMDEDWAELHPEIAEEGHGPSGLDDAALASDLDNLA